MKSKKTSSSKSRNRFPKNSRPLPPELIGIELCLPADVRITEMEWHDRFPSIYMPWKFLYQGCLTGQATYEEERAAEGKRILALPDAKFKSWLSEQQRGGAL